MTQEEKQLLLKDLCARLPYKPQIKFSATGVKGYEVCELLPEIITSIFFDEDIEIKPYLRPMSSMTEEEFEEVHKMYEEAKNRPYLPKDCDTIDYDDMGRMTDWLNAHHFDYRGLIEKGLALEAPKEMYKTE